MAMLSLLLTMAGSAQAEGSWCLNKGGTGSTNCGYYSYQQCMASVSGGTSFCTQNGFIKTIRPAVLFDANKNSPGVGRAKATWWGVSYTQTPL